MSLKKFDDWKKGSFYEFLQIGDKVDEGFYHYFVNTLPPVTYSATLVQMGEPYSHIDGRATYATLSKEDGFWVYKGHCFKGNREHVKSVS